MPSKTRFGRIYPHYLFRDHDPVLDWVDYIVKGSGETIPEVAARSGVTSGTLGNWRRRKTKRPQFTTVAAVATALGHDSIPLTRTKKKGRR